MEKKAFFRLSFAAVVAGGALFALCAPSKAAETQLIWSANSPVVNQSTEALSKGQHVHAIRFAKDVLRTKTQPANHLIARQNLCLAYLAQGKADDAKPYCDAALSADARTQITERDGRLTVASETAEAGAATLEAAVRTNVARAQGDALAENR
ncbi:MAG: hypothetical protein AB7I36_05360 [Rhodospirillaceae bacterium]